MIVYLLKIDLQYELRIINSDESNKVSNFSQCYEEYLK